uniref:Uncharacterized protein n=1 Tax=Arundo donax TaxID=35708 RepID=A0A0A9F4B3_ARUDO
MHTCQFAWQGNIKWIVLLRFNNSELAGAAFGG